MKHITHCIITSILTLASLSAQAVDSLSIEAGQSFSGRGKSSDMARIAIQSEWEVKWFAHESCYVTGYWDWSTGYWHSNDKFDSHETVDFGFTPTFRLRSSATSAVIPYAEFAVGAHYLTNNDISDKRKFSTHFQFGEHLGLGLMFGERGQYDLSYRVQHLSNAGIDSPNPGINFNQIRLQYHF